ncbi:hypothetical protein [Algibacter pectinivorans]|uniref:SpoIIAA-like n=1 Tax=Algibacter pectinivorans TaxID=870482 RepID=A0A1I1RI27_9FLAO|nr:hypothetical protein [Algibacter pectinivorans]SFD33832.1 hypothetical protein SAMN04487987_1107 [Algibacter pectinivorans]
MTIENYAFFKTYNFTKLEFSFGNFYLSKTFFVGEINEGVHFDWTCIEEAFKKIKVFYGKEAKVAYISNRIKHYSIDPSNWTKVQNSNFRPIASAIVIYNNSSYMNASIEKKFTNISIKRCMSLKEAIDWVENLNEFN